jgi:hypothetical protein
LECDGLPSLFNAPRIFWNADHFEKRGQAPALHRPLQAPEDIAAFIGSEFAASPGFPAAEGLADQRALVEGGQLLPQVG